MRSIQWRIAAVYALLIFITMGIVTAYLLSLVRGTYLDDLQARLDDQAKLIAQAVTPYIGQRLLNAQGQQMDGPLQTLTKNLGNSTGARVTVIAADGTVLADAWEDPTTLENHATRPEVVAALQTGAGKATRYSTTLHEDLMYSAVAIGKDASGHPLGVARVALPLSQVNAAVQRIVVVVAGSALLVTLLAALVAVWIARRLTRSLRGIARVASEVAAGDLAKRAPVESFDEVGDVARALNGMTTSLQTKIDQLAAERNQQESVLATMSDGVMVVDGNGKVVLANAAAESLTGVMLRRADPVYLMDATREHALKDAVDACAATGTVQRRDIHLMLTGKYVRVVAAPAALDYRSILLVLQDLTEARRIDATRRAFVANVSHELRTPLSAVKALVETLRGGASQDPKVADDYLRRIENETDRMTRMVNELLELSQLETGDLHLALAPTPPERLLAETAERFRPIAEGRGIALSTEAETQLPNVTVDSELIHRVLSNLVANSLKFTPDGGKITLAARTDGKYVRFEVHDTGSGIAPEHLPHIFERFYKADRSRTGNGAGLGLAIAKHIVQLHGGDVGADSVEGAGTTVWFTIPAPKV